MSVPDCLACGKPVDSRWATARDVEYETTADEFAYWLCERCDCLVIDPVPRDRLAEIYPSNYYSFAGGGDVLASERGLVPRVKSWFDRRLFREVLRASGSASPSILDVGGGTGDICASLVEVAGPGARGTVVDFDPKSIAVARERGLNAETARFEDFETDESFDVVLLLNLIEHVDDPVGTLRRAGSLLSPGGVVWIQTPNFRSLDARIFRNRSWAGLHCPRHWVIYSEAGLDRGVRAAGLVPFSLRSTQAGAFWSASLLGVLRDRQPGRHGRALVHDPLFLPLAGMGAAFDLVTRPLRRTSQVVCLAGVDGR